MIKAPNSVPFIRVGEPCAGGGVIGAKMRDNVRDEPDSERREENSGRPLENESGCALV